MNKTKLYKFVNILISSLILAIAFYIFYSKFNDRLTQISFQLFSDSISNIGLILCLLGLMCVNWLLETNRWYRLIRHVQLLSPSKRVASVLVGISASLVTPYRIGDIGARLLHIEKSNRSKALYYNAFLALSQLLVTLLFGLLAFSYLYGSYAFQIDADLPHSIVIGLTIVMLVTILTIYFNGNLLNRLFKLFSKNKHRQSKLSFEDRWVTLLLGMLRYGIFCIQFYMLLVSVNLEISFFLSSSLLSLIFVLKTVIPTSMLSDVLVRFSLSYAIFEWVDLGGIHGVFGSCMLWAINLFIPALLGLVVVPKIKWIKSTES